MNSPWLKYGLYYAIVSIALFLINIYVTPVSGWIQFFLGMGLYIYFGKLAVDEVREAQNGFNTYGDAFLQFFMIAVVSLIVNTVITMALFGAIDPDAYEVMADQQKESAIAMAKWFGADEAAIEKIEEDSGQPYSMATPLIGVLGGVIMFAIFAAIIGLFFKKEEKFY